MRLRDLLQSECGLRLVVGAHQLERRISWVYTTDLRDPSRYLFGGELVLTSGLWHHGRADSEAFVHMLDGAKVAALAVGVGYLGTLPDDLVATCQMYHMPLFEISGDVSFRTVSEVVVDRTSASRAHYLTSVLLQLRKLLATASEGRTEAVLSQISAALDTSCWLLSPMGRVLAGTAPLSPSEASAAAAAGARRSGRSSTKTTTATGRELFIVAAEHRQTWARLLVCERNNREWPLDRRELIADAAQMLALDAWTGEQRHGMQQIAQRLLDLLARDDSNPSDIAAILRLADFLSAHAIGVVIASSDDTALAALVLDDLLARLQVPSLLAAGDHDSVAFLTTGADGPSLLSEVHAFTCSLEPVLGPTRLRVGVGDPGATIAALRRSLMQAQSALVRARASNDTMAVAGVDDLATASTLMANVTPDVRSAYRNRVLGPVLAYDRARNSELEATLRVYLDTAGSLHSCADALHVHINTVRYRLRRVGDLTGRNLSSTSDRVDLYIATHIMDSA